MEVVQYANGEMQSFARLTNASKMHSTIGKALVNYKTPYVTLYHNMSHHDTESSGEPQKWFTPNEAATYLRVTRRTIYRYMDEKLLPYYELSSGRGRRIRKVDLDALLKPPQDTY